MDASRARQPTVMEIYDAGGSNILFLIIYMYMENKVNSAHTFSVLL